MDTSDILIIGGGIAIVGVALYMESGSTSTGSSGTSTSTWSGTAYARNTTYTALKSDTHQAWRVPGLYGADEWGSMCGTFNAAFGYDVCNAPTNQLNGNTILSWFKAMNIDPIKNQNYASLYKKDIEHFLYAVPQQLWSNVVTNSGWTGVSGLQHRATRIGCGLEGISCLG